MKRFLLSVIGLFIFVFANAQFTPGNIVVSRVGDGVVGLTSASTQVQLVEYTTGGVATGVVVTLPTTTSGTAGNRACTNSGSSTTEGMMTLSYDGRFLVHAGYDAIPLVANISTSTTDPNRTIARVDAAGNIDISTSFNATTGNAYIRNSIRSVTSIDGTSFWASGTGNTSSGGVRYLTLGQDNVAGTQISTTITNSRNIQIVNDQLYISAQSGAIRVATVGTGIPTTSGQTITNLPANIPTATTSPVSFIFFDRDASVSGPDLLYFLSQIGTAGEFGLFKYSYDGTTWTSRGSLADATTNNSQASGLTGYLNCSGNVVLYLTRATGSTAVPTEIRTYTDNAAYNATMTSGGTSILASSTLLVSAGTNYAFRGITMAPAQGYTVTGAQAIAAGSYNVITVKSGGTATLTGNITVYDRIIVESGGTLDMGSFVISSPAGIGSRFEVKSGGSIKIGHADGITSSGATGNVQTCFRTFDAGANYEYKGSAVQSSGNGLPAALSATLKINNSAGIGTSGVTLSQATSVSGTLNMTLGKLTTTSANLVTLASGASLINATATSFINGPIKKVGSTDFTFPVGVGSIYAPIGISGGTGATATDEFTAEYKRANPQSVYGASYTGGIDHISFVEYWTLDRNVGSASKIVSLDVHQTSFCAVPATTFVSRFNGAQWTNEPSSQVGFGPCGTYQCGTITTNAAITSFSPFTLATTDPVTVNPLPVKLISFDVMKRSSTTSLVNWALAECCSKNARFEVQKSSDGKTFSTQFVVSGSETNRFYYINDDQLGKGITYYRLKIIDENGSVKYSKIAVIINDNKGLVITNVSPNPVQQNATLALSTAKKETVQFEIYNISGARVKNWTSLINEGNNTIELSLSDLRAGVYHIIASTPEAKTVFRFVKQ